MASLTSLKKKRGTIKGKLTRFETALNEANLGTVKSRMKEAETLLPLFEEIQDEIENLEDSAEEHLAERIKFEEDYHRCMGLAITLLEPPVSQMSSASNQSESSIKLPTMNLPVFDGNFEHWLHFHDSFKSLIHDNTALSDIQKFHYLRSSLKDIAVEVIRSLEVSAANYQIAWDLLRKRFDNKRLMIGNHLQAILDISSVSGDVGTALRQLLDNVQKHTRALETLKANTWNEMLIHVVTNKLDTQTKREWKTFIKDKDAPTTDQLTEFLEDRCAILYTGNVVKSGSKANVPTHAKTHGKQKSSVLTCAVAKTVTCVVCKEAHYLYQCPTFKDMSVQSRKGEVAKHKLCVNCLRDHHGRQCTFSRCKSCNQFHNTLLHVDSQSQAHGKPTNKATDSSDVQPCGSSDEDTRTNVVSLTQHCMGDGSEVLLSTALVLIHDNNGGLHQCRALLDSGSQLNVITKELGHKLGLPRTRTSLPIGGLNDSVTKTSERMHIELQSRYNGYRADASFIVVDSIVNRHPMCRITNEIRIPENLTLADPTFNCPGKIDIIIGAEIFWDLICVGKINLGKGKPVMQKTKLGWIIAGRLVGESNNAKSAFCGYVSNDALNEQLQRFWTVEDCNEETFLSNEERQCEEHFAATHSRDETGRFTVSLPLRKTPIQLGDSKNTAVKRFYALERKLRRLPELQHQYAAFMGEYLALNHMTEVTDIRKKDSTEYFIPHHSVLKESSSTTKLRVVFDASSKTTTNVSLNDILMVGPTIQQDLLSILLRFRQHIYVFTADIEKMYRQINVAPADRALQQIVWRFTPEEPLREFVLNTVTYGLASSSYLAIRCLHQLARDNKDSFPDSSVVIENDFYVDDLLSGADTIEDAKRIKTEVAHILQSGGFNLRKWMANDASLTGQSHEDHTEPMRSISEENKALGLFWDPQRDELQYRLHLLASSGRPTKRTVLSTISQIFDPLGLVGPVIIKAKIILQKLWLLKTGWDESIPMDLHTEWVQYVRQLQGLGAIRIPRGVRYISIATELHGFCDASEAAYGACLYLRPLDHGVWTTRLLCAKSKVAPIKNTTLPRLELCGALLLARLSHKMRRSLTVTLTASYYWCDSTIALAWISGEPCQWKTFIANRVSEIQTLTDKGQWRHIRSEDNPADVISRGIEPQRLAEMTIWWAGPTWLTLDHEHWPAREDERHAAEDIPEAKTTSVIFIGVQRDFSIFERYSSLSKLKRIICYCLRFVKNASNRDDRATGPLSIREIDHAMIILLKLAQTQEFPDEIMKLEQGQKLPNNSKLLQLAPFLDKDGLIRVGGRLENSELTYEQCHPIILHPRHALTRLIIRDEHYRALHAGTQALLAIIRARYWILSGKNVIKNVLRNCIICFRSRPRTHDQLMGNLPSSRVTPARPFSRCGVDYAGPFTIKVSRNKTGKAYLCLFICFTIKAIHLELVSDLSTSSFLNAFKRFISRRGKPHDIYSDNGTNFVGAHNELKEWTNFLRDGKHQAETFSFLREQAINWHFIPAHSPHFGGLWEAGVKSVKTHARKIIGKAALTFEELYTIFSLIEACVNSRPLIPMSNDPMDFMPLTPGHFLIGEPLTALPELDVSNVPLNRLTRFEHLMRLRQHFWSRWSTEYLTHLQQCVKWNCARDYSTLIGALVILKDDNLPPMQWRLGRITQIHPGKDGLIRVVTIKTKNGTITRTISKICVLPLET